MQPSFICPSRRLPYRELRAHLPATQLRQEFEGFLFLLSLRPARVPTGPWTSSSCPAWGHTLAPAPGICSLVSCDWFAAGLPQARAARRGVTRRPPARGCRLVHKGCRLVHK
eukprot:163104-Prorocentrum_minimum.AAC.1